MERAGSFLLTAALLLLSRAPMGARADPFKGKRTLRDRVGFRGFWRGSPSRRAVVWTWELLCVGIQVSSWKISSSSSSSSFLLRCVSSGVLRAPLVLDQRNCPLQTPKNRNKWSRSGPESCVFHHSLSSWTRITTRTRSCSPPSTRE